MLRTDTPVSIKLEDYTPYPFEIDEVSLDFSLDPKATRVKARMKVRRTGEGSFVLDGVKLKLNAISLDGKSLGPGDYSRDDEKLTISNVPDQFTLETDVTIDPSSNTALSGLYISGGRFCSQCEATGFRHITYWPDRPDVMSRFHVRMDADKSKYPILLSNGTPGESGDHSDGRHYAEWDDPHPKPSYLFALCAGDYDVWRDTFTTMNGDHVDLGVYVDKGQAARAEWAMESLKASMKWDEERFGRAYDLGVFNIVAVRDFNFGAMENKGLNIFNSAYVLASQDSATDADFEAIESIVGHEYFHNWTGNRITCRDWFQLCLKEGLTVFRDQEFSSDLRSRPVQRIKDVMRLRARQFAEDAGPLAHPVRPDKYASIDNLYTATVYEKGSELIRALTVLIGIDDFNKGMQIYFDEYDGTASTIEDFYGCFEKASGKDLSQFRRWYAQAGTPSVRVEEDWNADTSTLTLKLRQSTPATPGQPDKQPVPIPLRVALLDGKGGHASAEGWENGETVIVLNDEDKTAEIKLGKGASKPLLSINRQFSAPVRIDRDLTNAQLLELAASETDPFNIWDNFQTLTRSEIFRLLDEPQSPPDEALVAALGDAVRANESDPAFAALLTALPDIGELFQHREPVDPAGLNEARKRLRKALGENLKPDAERILAEPSPAPFEPNAEQAGIRALRSAMIGLTGALDTGDAAKRLKALFDAAPNMTESLACLRTLVPFKGAERDEAIETFYERWKDNPLVIDKWFAVQAGQGTAEDARRLSQHPDFDLSNPNRVRSVAAAFSMTNLAAFHAKDGEGHKVIGDIVLETDKRNPALAARLLTSFEQWRKLEPAAKASAEKTLKALQAEGLSENAADILSRAID
ncbi:aminopeptidase N [Henriciella sp.]|jgi:aminopeptidase N|uniref:aminopeptidase N n=1 Tax=Henriciella sp. TaxID=1968823 RepID=UPI000C121533|nr:aminopeptidase N [Henriciella sp.]PHR79637.1 MAG: aminopeptidase N [Henriciella sp.]|tara:strand:+ start:23454 stop:26051 length:2598 start_codon:yes stop_codon:yes gene_type:complete